MRDARWDGCRESRHSGTIYSSWRGVSIEVREVGSKRLCLWGACGLWSCLHRRYTRNNMRFTPYFHHSTVKDSVQSEIRTIQDTYLGIAFGMQMEGVVDPGREVHAGAGAGATAGWTAARVISTVTDPGTR